MRIVSVNPEEKTAEVVDVEECRRYGVPVGTDPGSLYHWLIAAVESGRFPARAFVEGAQGAVRRVAPAPDPPAASKDDCPRGKIDRAAVVNMMESVAGPRLNAAAAAERLAVCRDCRCVHRHDGSITAPAGLYCGACGCPKWFLSRLDVKVKMANLRCPLGFW